MSKRTNLKCPECNSVYEAKLIFDTLSTDGRREIKLICTNDKKHNLVIDLKDINFEDKIQETHTKKINEENEILSFEDKYWNLVNEIDWKNKHNQDDNHYYDTARVKYIQGLENKEKYEEVFYHLKSKLMTVFDNYVENKKDYEYPLGDDSTNDFISHICGEGKEEYYFYLNNPKKMYKRADKEGYLSESFSYIWLD